MQRLGKVFSILAVGLIVMMATVDFAEARRAGGFSSFGSRGTRTFSSPSVTRTAPNAATGIQRSMTPQSTAARQNSSGFQRNGLFGGLGGGILGGLLMGGLFGMLLGSGFGGGFGFIGMLLQIILLVMLGSWLLRRFGGQQATATGGAAGSRANASGDNTAMRSGGGFGIPKMGSGMGSGFGGSAPATKDIEVGEGDLDRFEAMLKDVQAAYADEDYSALRELTTPEAMSYLAEELSDSATQGQKNVVRDVRLVEGDISEAWSEGNTDYATVAMRYESIDYMIDRTSGAVVSGNPDSVSDSVEVWTFTRQNGGAWKVSAIQNAG